jgi:hypothetical protein
VVVLKADIPRKKRKRYIIYYRGTGGLIATSLNSVITLPNYWENPLLRSLLRQKT